MRKGQLKALVRVALVLLSLASLGVMSWAILRPHEPVYMAKTASEWVEIYCVKHYTALPASYLPLPNFTRVLASPASVALNKLGTNATPYVLALFRAQDSALKDALVKSSWSEKLAQTFNLGDAYKRWSRPATLKHEMACELFFQFPSVARGAIPELIQVLRTSDKTSWRMEAVDILQNMGTNAQDALPMLLEGLRDRDEAVRARVGAAVSTIGFPSPRDLDSTNPSAISHDYCRRSSELILPKAFKLLTDPSVDPKLPLAFFCDCCLEERSIWPDNPQAATPSLLRLLNNPHAEIRARATNALKRINPSALYSSSTNSPG
jgi:hypothetical protein